MPEKTATQIYHDTCEAFWQYYFTEKHPNDLDWCGWRPGYRAFMVLAHIRGYDNQSFTLWLRFNRNAFSVHIFRGKMGTESAEKVQERIDAYRPALQAVFPSGLDYVWDQDEDGSGRAIELQIDPYNRDNWAKGADFIHERLRTYRKILMAPPPSQA